jgi:hypothetical protein
MEQQTTSEPSGPGRTVNNKHHGVATEFTLVIPLKPGGAEGCGS